MRRWMPRQAASISQSVAVGWAVEPWPPATVERRGREAGPGRCHDRRVDPESRSGEWRIMIVIGRVMPVHVTRTALILVAGVVGMPMIGNLEIGRAHV